MGTDNSNVTEIIAERLASTQFIDLTEDAVQATKVHILHTLGTILAGSGAPGIQQVLAAVRHLGAGEESTVLVHGDKLPAPSAALANATMAHSRELDINDDRIAYKTSVAAIPAVLATAERVRGVSGKELITAVCLGVDFGIRVGLATNPKPVHARFIALGPFAAAIASSKVLRLDRTGISNALGIAYCRVAIAGNSTVSPSLTKRLGAGFASHSGVLAARLAAAGFPASGEVFQGASGFFQTFYKVEGDLDLLLDGLGSRYEITSVGPKPYPSCRYTHPAITGVLAIREKDKIPVEQIEEVHVHVGKRDMQAVWGWREIDKEKRYRPRGIVDAQFSIPYTVAVSLLKGKPSLNDFTEKAIRDESVLRLAKLIKPLLNPQLDEWPQDVKPQIVEILTRNGKVYSQKVEFAKGNPRNPISLEELHESFKDMARNSVKPLTEKKIEKIISTVSSLESLKDVRELADLLI